MVKKHGKKYQLWEMEKKFHRQKNKEFPLAFDPSTLLYL